MLLCGYIQSPEIQHGSLLALGFTVGRYLAKKKVRMAEQQDLETNADFLPDQEELIQSATETIGDECAHADLHLVASELG